MITKKTVKKIVSISLALVLSVNSFAAIVSDNDGAAFVTKAEFEALKEDFANQVENYESSVDGKIDGAIAAYLAGIKTTRKTTITNMFKNAKTDNAKNLAFMLLDNPRTPYNVDDVLAGYFIGRSDGGGGQTNSTSGRYYGYCQVSNVNCGSGAYNECEYLGTTKKDSNDFYNDSKKNWTSGYYFVNFPFKGENEKTDLENFTLQDKKRKRLHMHLKANNKFLSDSNANTPGSRFTGTLTTDFTTSITQPGSFQHSSQGTNVFADMEPFCTQVHTWSDLDKDANFSTEDDTKNNAFLEYNLAGTIDNTVKCYAVEYEYRDYYNSNDSNRFGSVKSKNLQIQDKAPNGQDATTWRGGGSRNAYYKNGSSVASPAAKHDVTFKFKYYYQNIFDLKWTKMTNKYYDTLFNEPFYVYNGIPITNMNQAGKLSFTLTLNNSTADKFKWCIMDKRHENGDLVNEKKESYAGINIDRVMACGELTGKKTHSVKIEFDKEVIWDKDNGDYLYLKVEPSENGQIITADIPGNVNVEYKTY